MDASTSTGVQIKYRIEGTNEIRDTLGPEHAHLVPLYAEIDINYDSHITGEYQFGRSDLWILPHCHNTTSHTTVVGKMDVGEVLLDIDDDALEDISTIYIHQFSTYSDNPEQIRFFVKSENVKRKQPQWRVACRTGGLIKAEIRMLNLHHIAQEMKKAGVRTSYEIVKQDDGTYRMILYPIISTSKIANNLAEAGELMKQSLSASMGKHSPIFLWNQILPMAYPNLGRCVQFHPELKFQTVEGEETWEMVEDYPIGEDVVAEFDEKYTRLAYCEIPYQECKNQEPLALPCRAILFIDERYKAIEPRVEFDHFYKEVNRRRKKPPTYPLSTEKLTCNLRQYQIEAIQFMIQRELQPNVMNSTYDIYRSIEITGGLYYFPQLGVFTRSNERPKLKVSGGILADEMGLGKTVELLGLIFSLRPDNFDWMKELEPTVAGSVALNVDPVRECVEFCVSEVVAHEEGIQGLHAILKTRLVRTEARSKNVYFNVNARHYQRKNIDHLPQISCHQCGVTCLTEKMHWKPEFTAENIPFLCPDCVFEQPALPSKATLIVVPQILVHQWYEEIRKHVKDDVVIDVYMGVEKQGYKHPVYLSRCDIVISSYETLRHELEYVAPGTIHNLRKRKYEQQRQVTTPLIAIDWWRICLDESQLVEGPSRMAGKMLSKVHSRARWCVTGTPMVTGPDDFSYLVNFLELYPFNIKNVWEAHVWNPWMESRMDRMYDFISSFFWRSSLNSVKNQLELPPVVHEVIEVSFSPLEERLYQEQVASCLKKLNEILDVYPVYEAKLNHLTDKHQKMFMDVFNKLRVFIVTGGSHVKSKAINQNAVVYSPEELFKRLVIHQRGKLEDKVREYMYSLCALGGLYFLYDPGKAFACYTSMHQTEQVLEKVNTLLEKHKMDKKVEIDRTQMIHFCQAMIDLLPVKAPNNPGTTMNVPMLEARIKEASQKYCARDTANLCKFTEDWNKIDGEWKYFDSNFENCLVWVLVHLEHMTPRQYEDLRVWVLQSELSLSAEVSSFYDCRRWTIPYRLYLWIKERLERQQGNIAGLRRKMTGVIFPITTSSADMLLKMKEPEFVKMVNCQHNQKYIESGTEFAQNDEDALDDLVNIEERRVIRNKKKFLVEERFDIYNCSLCEVERAAVALECELEMTDGEKRVPLELNEWYLLLKEISNKRIPGQVMSVQVKMLWKWFEHCRRTVLLAHKAVVAMKEVICRYRELVQARKRLTFGMELEVPIHMGGKMALRNDGRTPEVERLINLWRNKAAECKRAITSIQTQLGYISSLKNTGDEDEKKSCPVCFDDMAFDWNVYPCAHYICSRCLHKAKFHSTDKTKVECIVCRASCSPDNILHVVNYETNYVPLDCLPRRILNVKYNSILRKLLDILSSNHTNKVLIFSSLIECLDGFCNLMTEAKIKHNRIHSMDPLKIATFRADPDIRVLALPMSTGSAGLNLTQANHLIFLEPSVQKASVSQAIGRIARMGQCRNMTIYNFIVKGSIESTIQDLTEDVCGEEGWTVRQLDELLSSTAAAQLV